MGDNVRAAVCNLVRRHRESHFGIHEREFRDQAFAADVAFVVAVLVGDDRTVGRFGTGCRNGQHDAYGQRSLDRLVVVQVVVPDVVFAAHRGRDGLRRIDRAAAAYRKDEIDPVFPADFDAFADERQAGIGLYSAEFGDVQPFGFERCYDPVVQAVALDRPAAVMQQHPFPIFGDFPAYAVLDAFAEDDFCRIVIFEIDHWISIELNRECVAISVRSATG